MKAIRLLLLVALAAGVLQTQPAAADQEGFPRFSPHGPLFDHDDLSFNPTDEWIFPTVLRAADYFEEPLGTYYLYTAPHDGIGGISLHYSDDLAGPWTEFTGNPVISNEWEPHYTVSHVSSPHAFWHPEEEQLFLYFHGENNETRLASSADGLTFVYEDVVLTAEQSGPGISEAAYARVFEYTISAVGRFSSIRVPAPGRE